MTTFWTLSAAANERQEWLEIVSVEGAPSVYTRVAGQVEVSVARGGDRFELPADIKAGPRDSAQVIALGVRVDVAPNSTLQFAASEQTSSGLLQSVRQLFGSALFEVTPGTYERFEVHTPTLVSVVKGTTFNVAVIDGKASVALMEGRLTVRSVADGDEVDLLPGDIVTVDADGYEDLMRQPLRAGMDEPVDIEQAVLADSAENVDHSDDLAALVATGKDDALLLATVFAPDSSDGLGQSPAEDEPALAGDDDAGSLDDGLSDDDGLSGDDDGFGTGDDVSDGDDESLSGDDGLSSDDGLGSDDEGIGGVEDDLGDDDDLDDDDLDDDDDDDDDDDGDDD